MKVIGDKLNSDDEYNEINEDSRSNNVEEENAKKS